jgi:polyribonucleotide nucleotidyltransferase
MKREGPPSQREILTMRMADRPIRPLWPDGFLDDVQVQTFAVSYDQQNDPDVLSVISASAALSLAKLPFLGPLGAVRIGMKGDEFVAFPDQATMAHSPLDLVVAGTKAVVVDTRKTIPGLRLAQKYAVKCGGGDNHRIGLYDAILIKENHIMAAGGIAQAMAAAQAAAGPGCKFIQIEVESLAELQDALAAGAKMVLLDNMSLDDMREACRIAAGQAITEASGGISLETLRAIAETGVDRISIGGLTKDVRALDLSMRFAL